MNNTTCQQLLNINTVSSAFENNQRSICERIISCFYSCYQSIFIKWATITYQQYPAHTIEFISSNAFTDGVLKLTESASRKELYQGNASMKTILFHYCRNRLLGQLTNEKRLAEKNKKMSIAATYEVEYNAVEAGIGPEEKMHRYIELALEKMEPADRQIVQWRHIEEKSNNEIAKLLAITVPSATNRIYRCMQKLRKLVEEMNK